MLRKIRQCRKSFPAVFFIGIYASGLLSFAQPLIPCGATSLSLGRVLSPEIPKVINLVNPASLADITEYHFFIGHAQPFLIKEIGVSSLHAVSPLGGGGLAVGLSEHFNSKVGYGMKLGKDLSAGIEFQYSTVYARNEFNFMWSLSPGIGLSYRLGENSILTSIISSPVSAGNMKKYSPGYTYHTAVGFSTSLYEDLYLIIEISGNRETSTRLKTGINYNLGNRTFIRAGYHTNPATYSAGMGCRLNIFFADIAMAWSPGIGITPALQLSRPIKQSPGSR